MNKQKISDKEKIERLYSYINELKSNYNNEINELKNIIKEQNNKINNLNNDIIEEIEDDVNPFYPERFEEKLGKCGCFIF